MESVAKPLSEIMVLMLMLVPVLGWWSDGCGVYCGD
jgi:hypothetical protein